MTADRADVADVVADLVERLEREPVEVLAGQLSLFSNLASDDGADGDGE